MDKNLMSLQRACISEGRLKFYKGNCIEKSLLDGMFLLKIPDAAQIRYGIRFCKEFYLDTLDEDEPVSYRGFREKSEIYFDREHFQTEHLLIDKPRWSVYLPRDLQGLVERMDEIGLLIMRNVLTYLRIEPLHWSLLSGGATQGVGTHWFAASHYRSERDQLGCAEHQDTGFVTILYQEQPGLEAWINNQWCSVDPVRGYFTVNFGMAFEILSKKLPCRVSAVAHRVRKCPPSTNSNERFSFATFVNSSSDSDLYEVNPCGGIQPVMSVESFLQIFNEATWRDKYEDFGILKTSEKSSGSNDKAKGSI